MSNMKQLAKELREVQKRANTDMEVIPYQTRNSIMNMKRDAEAQLPALKERYLKIARSNTLGIFLTGDEARVGEFAYVAAAETGAAVVRADELYQRLANKVEPSLGGAREFQAQQLQGLIAGLTEITKEMDIRRMTMPRLKNQAVVKDRDALVSYIRQLMLDAVGNDLTIMHVDRQINQQAIDNEFTGTLLPVVVTMATAEEIAALGSLFTNASTVSVGTSEDGAVDKEYVLNHLTQIKKKLKKSTTNGESHTKQEV